MKKILFIVFTLLCASANAQDVITTKKGEEIESKVIKIGTEEIEYKKWSNLEGPSYTLQKNQVFMIKYQNGDKEVFENGDVEHVVNTSYANVARDNYGSTSLYKFDDKQNLLDQAARAERSAKIFDWVAFPLGAVIGIGGMFAFDEGNMIWVGLGVEVGAFIISECMHSKARRLERQASLYYGMNYDFNVGNHKYYASSGLLSNGKIGVVLSF